MHKRVRTHTFLVTRFPVRFLGKLRFYLERVKGHKQLVIVLDT